MSASVPGTAGASREGQEGERAGGQRDCRHCVWGVLCPSLARAEDGLWS